MTSGEATVRYGGIGRDVQPATASDAVAALYVAHRLQLLRLAVFLVDDRTIAEDLVQDAFAGLYQRWARLADTGAALGYLRTSIVNGARSAQRRSGVVSRHLQKFQAEDEPPADFALLIEDQHRTVIHALRRLPQRQREVLVLRYWAELSEAEIAETLGVSRGTVKASASRGLDALEESLKEAR